MISYDRGTYTVENMDDARLLHRVKQHRRNIRQQKYGRVPRYGWRDCTAPRCEQMRGQLRAQANRLEADAAAIRAALACEQIVVRRIDWNGRVRQQVSWRPLRGAEVSA